MSIFAFLKSFSVQYPLPPSQMHSLELYFNFMHNIFRLSIGFSKGQRYVYSDEFLHPHDVNAKESILFCITGRFSDSQLFTGYCNSFSNKLRTNQSVFYYTITGVEVEVTPLFYLVLF